MTQPKQPARRGQMTREQFEKEHGGADGPLFDVKGTPEKGFGKKKFGTGKF